MIERLTIAYEQNAGHGKPVRDEPQGAASGDRRHLEMMNSQLLHALDYMSEGIALFDQSQRMLYCNEPYAHIYHLSLDQLHVGITLAEIVKLRIASGLYSEGSPANYLRDRTAIVTEASDRVQTLNDGRSIFIRRRIMPFGGWLTCHEDITDQLRVQSRIEYFATHDALTGVRNRASFQEAAELAVERARRGCPFAVIWIDLDRFKHINDTHGHAIGDKLLKIVASRISGAVRPTDMVARLGGDEFAILVDNVDEPDSACRIAERLLSVLADPYHIKGAVISTHASMGIALGEGGEITASEVMHNADFALYRAKQEGRGTYRFFKAEMDEEMKRKRIIERELRLAIVRNEFELHYQPIVNLESRQVTCFEALIRWRHPERGLVPPIEFLPLAEEIGLIVPIGAWVVAKACEDAAAWPSDVSVAVNLSAVQFKHQGPCGAVRAALEKSGLAPERLQVEVTETMLLENDERTFAFLRELHQMGVRISLDDFGTGYSSLRYLNEFPFDKIKVDRSFIKNLPEAKNSLAIVRSVAGLARSLGMVTTAEGVETDRQLDIAEMEGCTEVQGYYFSAPRPASEIADLIELCGAKASAQRAA